MTGLHAYCGGLLTLLLAFNILLYAEAGKVCTFIVILGFFLGQALVLAFESCALKRGTIPGY